MKIPKFIRNENVRVIKGFYKGEEGKLVSCEYSTIHKGYIYYVEIPVNASLNYSTTTTSAPIPGNLTVVGGLKNIQLSETIMTPENTLESKDRIIQRKIKKFNKKLKRVINE